jgi:hypothetical protein
MVFLEMLRILGQLMFQMMILMNLNFHLTCRRGENDHESKHEKEFSIQNNIVNDRGMILCGGSCVFFV